MKNKKILCKIVLDVTANQYEIWITDHEGKWCLLDKYCSYIKDSMSLVSSNILHIIDDLINEGYTFLGIEKYKSNKKGAE